MAWNSTFIKTDSAALVAAWLTDAFTVQGWQAYDPFPGGAGTPFSVTQFAKTFTFALSNDWTRIVSEGALPDNILRALSVPVLRGWLDAERGGWDARPDAPQNGELEALEYFILPGGSRDELTRALAGRRPVEALDAPGLLPPDVDKLARDRKVNPKQADKLIDRMASSLFARAGGADARSGAQAMLGGSADWNSDAGKVLRAVAAVLHLPEGWREPDFIGVKDAYQAARALARNPRASLLSGERDALARFPAAAGVEMRFFAK